MDFFSTELPDVQLLYIFGSEAKGETNTESDIDLAVLCENKLQAEKLWNIRLSLANILNRDIDLVNLKIDNAILKMEIIYHGECIFKTDESTRQLFESRVIEDYIELKELIKPIEDEIRLTGKIYNF